jgi:hypothetical protein
MFDTELAGLRKLIADAEAFCARHHFPPSATAAFIEERSQKYIDIVAPVIAAKPEIYEQVVRERPSLAQYLSAKMSQHMQSVPPQKQIVSELKKALEDFKGFNGQIGPFRMGDVTSVQILLGKYGFSQEVIGAIQKVKPELFNVFINLYDMRLKAAQTISDPEHREDR